MTSVESGLVSSEAHSEAYAGRSGSSGSGRRAEASGAIRWFAAPCSQRHGPREPPAFRGETRRVHGTTGLGPYDTDLHARAEQLGRGARRTREDRSQEAERTLGLREDSQALLGMLADAAFSSPDNVVIDALASYRLGGSSGSVRYRGRDLSDAIH